MKRLFFALWPSDAVRKQCVEMMQSLDTGWNRPIKPENVHVTLVFLGHLNPEKETALKQETAFVLAPVISQRFDRLSYWKKPGILCLTAAEIDRGLSLLVGELTRLTKKLAIPVEERTYHPHITLFRKTRGIAEYHFTPVQWESTSFCLVESHSYFDQTEYRIVESWDLAQ